MPTKERWAQMTPEQRRAYAEARRLHTQRKRQDPEWAERERRRERERHQRRKLTEPERIRDRNRKASAKQYANHGDKRRAQRRDYRNRNQGTEAEHQKRYRQTERGRELARQNAKAYRLRNPQVARLYQWRKRNSPSEAREWALILLGDPCCYCGNRMREIDHIDAVVNGGTGDWSNLTAACLTCNRSKGPRPLLLWLATATAA